MLLADKLALKLVIAKLKVREVIMTFIHLSSV